MSGHLEKFFLTHRLAFLEKRLLRIPVSPVFPTQLKTCSTSIDLDLTFSDKLFNTSDTGPIKRSMDLNIADSGLSYDDVHKLYTTFGKSMGCLTAKIQPLLFLINGASVLVNGASNFENGASVFVYGASILSNDASNFANDASVFVNDVSVFVYGASNFENGAAVFVNGAYIIQRSGNNFRLT